MKFLIREKKYKLILNMFQENVSHLIAMESVTIKSLLSMNGQGNAIVRLLMKKQ